MQDCLERTDWKAVSDAAPRARMSQACTARPEYTSSGSSLARLLEFEDGTLWIARIQLASTTAQTRGRAQADVDAMAFLASRTKAPVPRVFASDLADDGSPTGVAFLLLEFLPGNTAFDESRLYNGWALIPRQFRHAFHGATAADHVS